MKEFKIRSSATGKIMTGGKEITEKQLETLNKLRDVKEFDKKKNLTEKQEETLNGLIDKRDNPELGETAKGYCKDWLKTQLYNSNTEIKSKYLDKGNIMEDESIDFIADELGYGFLLKNEDHFSNDFMMGTPDVILNDLVIDVKNSWDCFPFPLFDTEVPTSDYYWQLQSYMYLTDRPKAKLIYCLLDTPEHLIANSAKWHSISQGYEEMDMDIYKRYHDNLTYEGVKNSLKIKVFDIERNDEDIQKIKDRVLMCRAYIDQLLKQI